MNTAREIFYAAKRREALQPVLDRMVGAIIKGVEFHEREVRIMVDDGDIISFEGWGDDCDQGLAISLNGKAIEDYFYSDFIGPDRPPRTAEEEAAYRASLGPFEGILYDEMGKIRRQLNDTTLLTKYLET